MRRTSIFLILTIASLISLVAVVIAGLYVFSSPSSQSPYSSLGNMWNGMMGNGSIMEGAGSNQTQAQNSAGPYFGVAFIILAGITVTGIVGLVYFFVFPEIKNAQNIEMNVATLRYEKGNSATAEVSPYESVVKTLTSDERKVIEVLSAHDGKYLQKYIRNETGLSRLQTHRIVARLAERGIVTLEKTGNTNNVLVANWLKSPSNS